MAFDGIVTKQVVLELKDVLIGGKINKVFEPNKNEIILGIYSGGKNYALNISISSNNYRMNLTTNSKPNPLNAPNFCMLLRKHLVGSRITNIYSNSLERVVFIDLEGYNELNDLTVKKLVVELMGKHSNIILLDSNRIIIDSLRHTFGTRCIESGMAPVVVQRLMEHKDIRITLNKLFYGTILQLEQPLLQQTALFGRQNKLKKLTTG